MSASNNEKTFTREEKTKTQPDHLTGGDGTFREQSEFNRNQQERVDRADSSESSVFFCGESIVGGTIRQLIRDYEEQLVIKQEEFNRVSEDLKRVNYRINEFKSLLQELESQKETV